MAINYPQRYDDDFLNTIKTLIDHVNVHGKTIQDLVADGQLTDEQYAELITVINGHLKSGDVDKIDLSPMLQKEIDRVNAMRLNTSERPIDVDEMNTRTKQLFTGGAVAVVGKNAVGNENIKNKAVDIDQTQFIDRITVNEVNEDWLIPGYLSANHEDFVESEYYFFSDYYVIVEPNEEISFEGVTRLFYYGEERGYIKTELFDYDVPHTVTIPDNAHYIRFNISARAKRTAMMNKGSELLPYEQYKYPVIKSAAPTVLKENTVGTDNIKSRAIQEKHVDFIKFSSNKFDWKSASIGAWNTDGEVVDDPRYRYLNEDNYIVVTAPEYTVAMVDRLALFDKDKTIIEVLTPYNNVMTIQTNSAKYMSVDTRFENQEKAQINEGNTLLEYEEYYTEDKRGVNRKAPVLPKTKYTSTPLESMTTSDPTPLIDYVTDDMYALYDQLMAEHPKYISRTTLKTLADGSKIYRYDFKPESVPDQSSNPDNDYPKIFLTTGSHGYEESSTYTAYKMFEKMCKEWKDNDVLEILRYNIHFVIIPVVNPHGFDRRRRVNENGVDILRNFPRTFYHHTSNTDPTNSKYRGAAPLSELETQAVWDVYQEGGWAYVGDYHNFGGGEQNDYYVMWIPKTSKFTESLAQRFIRIMSNKWKQEYNFFPQEDDILLGYSNDNILGIYGEAYMDGITANLIETTGRIQVDSLEDYTSNVLTIGLETITNWMYLIYLNCVEGEWPYK